MARKQFVKGNLYREDYFRSVVTDTSPQEVPLIVSNDGFYNNLKSLSNKSSDTKLLLERFLDQGRHRYTVPYRFRIAKDETSTRRLSLLHPRAQLAVSNFYQKYAEVICHYNSRSKFSIRAPAKPGSTYFYRSSVAEKNKYKGSGIDTLQFEKRVRNPASYFAYKGEDRQYKFFDSPKYSRLEKKYRVMWMGDVSKCFDSIYTHSITWAVKDMPFAKNAIGFQSFGDDFDRLMQGVNYNETNGVCIGPEVSRIFAETIFQRIDVRVELRAAELGYQLRRDYECVRYVDDIIIFATNSKTALAVYGLFEKELGKFNLHLNELKLNKFARPFHTKKSWTIRKLVDVLQNLQDKITCRIDAKIGTRITPVHIFKSNSIRLNFISDIKAVCIEIGVGYDMVSNYIIASLSNRLEDILDGYKDLDAESRANNEDYLRSLLLLLDLIFHFYSLHPTVNSSFRVAKAIVLALRFVETIDPKRKPYIFERMMQWTTELIRSFEEAPDILRVESVPIEVINVVLALSEHDDGTYLTPKFLVETVFAFDSSEIEYFSTVSLLFFIGSKPKYKSLLADVEKKLLKKFSVSPNPDCDAHDAHLLLDMIACPYLSMSTRIKLVSITLSNMGLPAMNPIRRTAIAKEIEEEHWFVNWSGIELLNMIKRKELSQVY